MNNCLIDFALSDFNLDTEKYNNLKRVDLLEITNNYIDLDNANQDCLYMSQQILLNNKKKVAFSNIVDTEEFKKTIMEEKSNYMECRLEKPLTTYDIPICEYIDVCMSYNVHKKLKKKEKSKYLS